MLSKYLKQFHIKNLLLISLAVFTVCFFMPSAVHAAYRDTVQADTPIYYWPMDETAGATSLTATVGGTAINLTGATAGASGQVDGTAVSFNGTSNFGATASSLDLTTYSKIVVEALMYIPSYNSTGKTAWEFNTSVSASSDTFAYFPDGGVSGSEALANVALKGNVNYSIATYTRPTAGNWHHVVAVYNTGLSTNEVDFYIDGVLQTVTARPYNGNNSNNFGNRILYLMARAGTSQFLNGKMQHLAIYSDLSESAITAHSAAAFAPASLSAGTLSETSHSNSTATVSWTAGSGGTAPITTQLQRSPSGAATWGDVSGATASPVTDSELTPATAYDYRVIYTDAVAATSNSNTLTVTLDALPTPATAITLSGPTTGTLGNASTNFTIGSNGSVTGSVVVTPSDSGAGGTFTPTTVTLTTTSTGTFTYTPSSTGTKTISVTNNGGLTNPSTINYSVVGSGLALGDSTVAAYAGQNSVTSYLYTSDQLSNGWTVNDVAVPGHTIAQQKTVYLSTASRSTVDYTIAEVGLNDLNPAEAASVAIARLQDLVDTINTNKKVGSLTIISTMTPARQRLIDVYGAINGPLSYQKWLDMNNAIKGLGSTPITGVDYRISNHTPLLDDGVGNLAAIYDTGDHIHENNAARQIIARVWRDSLAELNLLNPATSSAPIIGTATAGDSSAIVTFTAPQFNGGSAVSGYTVASSPAGGIDTNAGSTNLSHTITGLTNGTSYTFTVTATNIVGASDASSASNAIIPVDTTAPSGVGAPTFSTITSSSIEIVKPDTVTESGVLNQWQARRNNTAELGLNATTTTSVTDSSLSENTQYTYDAQFNDSAGNTSIYGTTAQKYTLADNPTNFSASLNSSDITLTVGSFSNDTSGSSGYYFSRSGTNSGWIQTNSWTDTGLSCGNSYTYSVKYRNGDGTETSEISTTKSTNGCGGGGGSPAMWTLPTMPSGGFKININGGALMTSNRSVVLGFNAGTDIKKIAISMTGDFTDASQEDYVSSKQWDLCSKLGGAIKTPTCPDGTYKVYVQFYTTYGRTTSNALASSTISLKSGTTSTENLQQYSNLPFTNPFTKYLQYRQTNVDIKRLQIFLNSDPDTKVADLGAGSPGKETNYFGILTYKAVIKFQEKYAKDVLAPWGFAKGTGYVGKTTLAKINELMKK